MKSSSSSFFTLFIFVMLYHTFSLRLLRQPAASASQRYLSAAEVENLYYNTFLRLRFPTSPAATSRRGQTRLHSSTTDDKTPQTTRRRLKPKVIFVLGGPGAGKGTQCEMLGEEFGLTHLSAGELLRQERSDPNSKYGALIDSFLKDGKIVPVEISLGLLRNAIERCDCDRYLIDGFPRNWDNVLGWNRLMHDVSDLEKVMFIECGEAEMQRRLVSRGLTSGRSDDNAETARKRFDIFNEVTRPVVEYYAELQRGGSGKSDDEDDSDSYSGSYSSSGSGSSGTSSSESSSSSSSSDHSDSSDCYLKRVDGSQSVADVYSELREVVVQSIQRDILQRTQLQRAAEGATLEAAVVRVPTGKTATVSYELVQWAADGAEASRRSCEDRWELQAGSWRVVDAV